MQQVAEETRVAFEGGWNGLGVPAPQRPALPEVGALLPRLLPQIRHPPRSPTSLGPFLGKLDAKHQSAEQRDQAAGG